jgi:hypothetical protein
VQARHPLALVVLEDGSALGLALGAELPLLVVEAFGVLGHALAVGLVGEVGAVRAAPLHQLRRGIVEHAGTACAPDARPVAGEEREVELPGVALFVVERHPLVEVDRRLVDGGFGLRWHVLLGRARAYWSSA